jgi:apolipoprotein N-acyltransferase
MVDSNGISLVVGSAEFNKFERKTGGQGYDVRHSNCAFYFKPREDLGPPYRKRILLPFGEYLPLESLVSWPEWLVPRMFLSRHGEGPDIFNLPDGTRFANIICWENLFPPFVRDLTQKRARLIVQLTNDNWFGLTSLPLHHTRASIFRAVENRIPVVVANNAGPSMIIDSRGRIQASLPNLFEAGFIVGEVTLGGPRPLYTRLGDWFASLALALSGLALLAGLGIKRRPDKLLPL